MSSEQETAPDELGVCWEPRPRDRTAAGWKTDGGRSSKSFLWPNNDTRVLGGYTKLHRWLHEQRRSFAKGKLREPRRRRLEGLGVDLKSESRRSWEDRVEELKEFRPEHGHCNVPRLEHNPSLGGWVKHQRMQFRADKLNAERKRRWTRSGSTGIEEEGLEGGAEIIPVERMWLSAPSTPRGVGVSAGTSRRRWIRSGRGRGERHVDG